MTTWPDDPNVMYFGPGIHEVAGVTVGSGKRLYVAAGAVVKGTVDSRGPIFTLQGKHMVLRGRGVTEGSMCPRHSPNLLLVRDKDITVEGVIFRDSSVWTIPIHQSDRVTVKNVKLLGYRANSDGIDVCNSRNVVIKGCFIRTLDDLIVVKTDKGREWTLRVFHCDAARVSNIRFENIRIEESARLIYPWIGTFVWTRGPERGHVQGMMFEYICAVTDQLWIEFKCFDEAHAVSYVALRMYGSMGGH